MHDMYLTCIGGDGVPYNAKNRTRLKKYQGAVKYGRTCPADPCTMRRKTGISARYATNQIKKKSEKGSEDLFKG